MQGRILLVLLAIASVSCDLHAAVPADKVNPLRARAVSQGEVRIIVGIAAPRIRLGDLSSAARTSRLQQIAGLQSALMSQARQSGLREIARFRTIPFMTFSVDAAALDRLANLPQVVSIQEDVPEAPALASSVPVIGAPAAWTLGYEGAGQTIAILDTGVQTSHAFFPPGKVLAEACFSSDFGLVGDDYNTSLCPGEASSSTAPGSGQNCPNFVSESCTHGTHVAGIAAGNDGVGPNIGVAKNANLITIQVFTCISSQPDCSGSRFIGSYVTDQVLALEHVLTLSESIDIAAVNMSLGGSLFSNQASCDTANTARKEAIDNLRSVGIATIIAAGNNGSKTSVAQPGCISSAISVGNTTDADDIFVGSNVASFVDLLAPGTEIDSAAVGGGAVSNTGTSMSTPHVAGAWAILREAVPDATVDEILQVLRETGESVDDQRSGGTVDDMRRINLDLALIELITLQPEVASNPAAGSVLDLGDVAVADMGSVFNLEVTNSGDGDLTLSCQINGAQAGQFSLLSCPGTIAAAAGADISLRCDPTSVGEFSAALTVSTNDISEPVLNFSLQCTGLGVEIVTLPAADSTLDFGNVLLNATSDLHNVQVSNAGNQTLTLGCNLAGADSDQFAITACPVSVPANAQTLVSVHCEPDGLGNFAASLQISSNDTDESLLSFPLSCRGVAPEIASDPVAGSELDFGDIRLGEASTLQFIEVANSGDAQLQLSCTLIGSDPTSFQVINCPGSVPSSSQHDLELRCQPQSVGALVAQLQIESNDEDEGLLSFDLKCQGLPPENVFTDGFEDAIP